MGGRKGSLMLTRGDKSRCLWAGASVCQETVFRTTTGPTVEKAFTFQVGRDPLDFDIDFHSDIHFDIGSAPRRAK